MKPKWNVYFFYICCNVIWEHLGRKYYSDKILPQVYAAVKNVIGGFIDKVPHLSFTCDIWSAQNAKSSMIRFKLLHAFTNRQCHIYSLTTHFITSEWSRKKFILCVRWFPGRHTGTDICQKIEEMLNEWRIKRDRCSVFVRDRGANMIKVNIQTMSSAYNSGCFPIVGI
jgi:hypothetical protein